jgi:hypothetical protein
VVGGDERGGAPGADVDAGWPSAPYGGGFEAWAALTRVITNRSPAALEAFAADSIPRLVTEAIATARRAGPDPVDWIYQSWAYDAHDVGTTPGFGGDTAAALRTVRAPTLLLVPELDLYNPVGDAIEAAGLIPGGTLVRPSDAIGAERSAPPWLDALAAPIVYATLGTTFNLEPGLWATVLDGLERTGLSVVATVGAEMDPASLGPRPARMRLERFLPQRLVLDRCAAHHARLRGADART